MGNPSYIKMTEKDLIRKIRTLRRIEPRKNWVLLTKSRILGQDLEAKRSLSFREFFRFQFALKPAFVLPVALLLIAGSIFYFSNLKDLKTAQVEYQQKLIQLQGLTPALVQLQANISQVRESLEKAEVKNPKQVLEIRKSVESAALAGKEVIAETKKMVEATSPARLAPQGEAGESEKIAKTTEPEAQILTSITETEKAIEELENSSQQKVKETVEYLLGEIEHWALGEIDQQRFEEAKEAYRNGDYNQALEKILFLGY